MKRLPACLLLAYVLLLTACAQMDAGPSSYMPNSSADEQDRVLGSEPTFEKDAEESPALSAEPSHGLALLSRWYYAICTKDGFYELQEGYDPAVDTYSQRLVYTDFTALAQTRVFTDTGDHSTFISAIYLDPQQEGFLAIRTGALERMDMYSATTATLYSAADGKYLGEELAADQDNLYLLQGDELGGQQLVRIPLAGGVPTPIAEMKGYHFATTIGDWLVLEQWQGTNGTVCYLAVNSLTGEQQTLAELPSGTYRVVINTTVYSIDDYNRAGVTAFDLATGETTVLAQDLPWSGSYSSIQHLYGDTLLLGLHDEANKSYLLDTASGETTELTLNYPDPRDGRIEVLCEAGDADVLVRYRYRTIHWTDEYSYPGTYAYFYYALLSKEDLWAGVDNYRPIAMEF